MLTTLADLLPRIKDLGQREAICYFDGYRTRKLSYLDLYRQIAGTCRALEKRGLAKGDSVLLWGENRPEWIVTFWACVARGIRVVPLDRQATSKLVAKIHQQVQPDLSIVGEEVEAEAIPGRHISFPEISALEPADDLFIAEIEPEDIVEIVYTSGTTGTPKGVPHRHKNLCANLRPFQKEISQYHWLASPFQPIRLLDLLPLSHMFGQSLGLYIPIFLKGGVVLTEDLHPKAVIETIRNQRVSVLVCVPRLLRQLQERIERKFEVSNRKVWTKGYWSIPEKWWKFRDVHSEFGWKFWAVVLGGAPVSAERENFWTRLGLACVQGYGLTEASPVVSVNHPFHSKRGSIGKVIPGQEVKIAEDGEILVRGDSVVFEYFDAEGEAASGDGWLHTGDIGEIDEEGRLFYRGRKKDVIVTSEGLNVYPSDVEEVLNEIAGVRESCVVSRSRNGEEVVHAVVILDNDRQELNELINEANQRLETHQQIRSWSKWPNSEFPKTSSTMNIKRREVAAQIRGEEEEPLERRKDTSLETVLAEFSARSLGDIQDSDTLDKDLGLTSLDRVDLMSRLEEQFSIELNESVLAGISSVGELRALIEEERTGQRWRESAPGKVEEEETPSKAPHRAKAPAAMPAWNRSAPARITRSVLQKALMLPLFHRYLDTEVYGLDQFQTIEPPVLLAANHTSHLDTIAVLAALPQSWRWRLAPAMAQERFRAHFLPGEHALRERVRNSLEYFLACWLFNAYPLPQRMGGVRKVLKYTGELVDQGYCPLVFPEGRRSEDGSLLPFKPGIVLMAQELGLPVLPVHLKGLFEIYSIHDSWPSTGSVQVRFGEPLDFSKTEDRKAAAKQLEEAIRELGTLN